MAKAKVVGKRKRKAGEYEIITTVTTKTVVKTDEGKTYERSQSEAKAEYTTEKPSLVVELERLLD